MLERPGMFVCVCVCVCVYRVEMKRPALKILEQRASLARLTNVSTYHGMIEQYQVREPT